VEDIINLIDNKKPAGVFQYLQSNTKLTKVGTGSAKFLTALNNNLKHNTLFNKKRLDRNKFTIRHSTGKIEYNTDFFIPNNQNELPDDIYNFFRDSSHPFYELLEGDVKL
jgi:myosin heavy subunit